MMLPNLLRFRSPPTGSAMPKSWPNSRPFQAALGILSAAGGQPSVSISAPRRLAAVGGWVDTTTLQKCYQVADEETMEAVVLQPRRLKRVG